MKRIISIIAVLSIIIFPTLAQACQDANIVRYRLIHLGYKRDIVMIIADKVSEIFVNDYAEFIQFKIEHDGTVCQLFSGRRLTYIRERKL